MITVQGSSNVVAEVDGTTFRAIRVTPRPVHYGSYGIYRLGASSGNLGALSSLAPVFVFRWTSSTAFALVYRVGISSGIISPGAAAHVPFLTLSRASNWTAVGAGGAVITPTGDNCKLRTSMATSQVGTIRISTTAAMGAGTRTIDNAETGAVYMGIGTAPITTTVASPLIEPFWLFDAKEEGGMPLVLRELQGLTLRNGNVTMSAGVLWKFAINMVWAEVTSF